MQVKNLKHLKTLSTNENNDFSDFHISLAGGLAQSSKRILYQPEFDEFSVINEIDESFQEFHSSEIAEETNLIEAIEKKCLFKD